MRKMRREVTGKVWIVRMSPSVGGLEQDREIIADNLTKANAAWAGLSFRRSISRVIGARSPGGNVFWIWRTPTLVRFVPFEPVAIAPRLRSVTKC